MTSSHSPRADATVFVSDGEDDETVIPIIRTIVPVISIQRIIIKHSRSVEYSYAVLGRYHQNACLRPTIFKILSQGSRVHY